MSSLHVGNVMSGVHIDANIIDMMLTSLEVANMIAPKSGDIGLEGYKFKIDNKYYQFENGKVVEANNKKIKQRKIKKPHKKITLLDIGDVHCHNITYSYPDLSSEPRIICKNLSNIEITIYESGVIINSNDRYISDLQGSDIYKFDLDCFQLSNRKLFQYIKDFSSPFNPWKITGGYLMPRYFPKSAAKTFNNL